VRARATRVQPRTRQCAGRPPSRSRDGRDNHCWKFCWCELICEQCIHAKTNRIGMYLDPLSAQISRPELPNVASGRHHRPEPGTQRSVEQKMRNGYGAMLMQKCRGI
jgi:hypothetical protein